MRVRERLVDDDLVVAARFEPPAALQCQLIQRWLPVFWNRGKPANRGFYKSLDVERGKSLDTRLYNLDPGNRRNTPCDPSRRTHRAREYNGETVTFVGGRRCVTQRRERGHRHDEYRHAGAEDHRHGNDLTAQSPQVSHEFPVQRAHQLTMTAPVPAGAPR